MVAGKPVKYESQMPYAIVDMGPRPLAVTEPAPLLALPALRADLYLKEVERRLGASQLGFQEAMIKHMQSLTDQMSLMIKSQQSGPPPPVESGRHTSDCRVFNVANRATLVSFVEVDNTEIKEETVVRLHKTKEVKENLNMDKVTIGDLLLEVKVVETWRRGSSIYFRKNSMHKVNVGPRNKVMVVAIVEETILRTNVVNWIRFLV